MCLSIFSPAESPAGSRVSSKQVKTVDGQEYLSLSPDAEPDVKAAPQTGTEQVKVADKQEDLEIYENVSLPGDKEMTLSGLIISPRARMKNFTSNHALICNKNKATDS